MANSNTAIKQNRHESAAYVMNDERFGNSAYIVRADNNDELLAEMPCIVDWANEHYGSLDSDSTTTRAECLADKLEETWDALEPLLTVPGQSELVACYEHGKYSVYTRDGDVLKFHSTVSELSELVHE